MRLFVYVFAAVLSLLGTGCVRVNFDSPAVQGQVIELQTGKPIEAALVFIKERPAVSVRSDASGRFQLPRVRETRIVPPIGDLVFYGCCARGTVQVQAEGFKNLERPIDVQAPENIELSLKLERK